MNEDEKRKFQVNHHPSLEHLDDSELSDALLDRLVDNELSEEEYRRVLALVSSKPDGWRQLAMAFLESQALEKELANLQGISLDHFAEAENLDLVDSNRKEEDVDSRQRITEFADHTDRPNRHDPRSSNTEKDEENFHRSYSQLNGLARRDDVNQDPSGEKRLSDAIPASKLNSSSRSFDPTAEEGTFGQLKRVALIATSIVAACFLLTYFAGTYLSYLQKK